MEHYSVLCSVTSHSCHNCSERVGYPGRPHFPPAIVWTYPGMNLYRLTEKSMKLEIPEEQPHSNTRQIIMSIKSNIKRYTTMNCYVFSFDYYCKLHCCYKSCVRCDFYHKITNVTSWSYTFIYPYGSSFMHSNNYLLCFQFIAFDMESPYDWLEVRDGDAAGDNLYERFTGDNLPKIIMSTGRSLFVRFHSDFTFSKTGFNVTYQAGRFDLFHK